MKDKQLGGYRGIRSTLVAFAGHLKEVTMAN